MEMFYTSCSVSSEDTYYQLLPSLEVLNSITSVSLGCSCSAVRCQCSIGGILSVWVSCFPTVFHPVALAFIGGPCLNYYLAVTKS